MVDPHGHGSHAGVRPGGGLEAGTEDGRGKARPMSDSGEGPTRPAIFPVDVRFRLAFNTCRS